MGDLPPPPLVGAPDAIGRREGLPLVHAIEAEQIIPLSEAAAARGQGTRREERGQPVRHMEKPTRDEVDLL